MRNAACGMRNGVVRAARHLRGHVVLAGALALGAVGSAGCEKLFGNSAPPPKSAPAVSAGAAANLPLPPSVAPTEVLAKVNDKTISARDLGIAVKELKAAAEAAGQTWKPLPTDAVPDQYDLRDLLDELVMAELRAQDGVTYGLGRQSDIQARFWYLYRTFFSREWVTWQLDQVKAEVTDEDVAQAYKENQGLFREPERVRVREFIVGSEDQAKEALVKLLQGADFVTVAQSSLTPEAVQGPAVEKQWVMRQADKSAFAPNDPAARAFNDPVLEQGVFAIDKPNGVSSYLKGADGRFHIFQLVERKEARQRPLTEVSDRLRELLQLQKLSKKSEQLKGKAKVETFPERLTAVEQ